jgi:hypothetical protein
MFLHRLCSIAQSTYTFAKHFVNVPKSVFHDFFYHFEEFHLNNWNALLG